MVNRGSIAIDIKPHSAVVSGNIMTSQAVRASVIIPKRSPVNYYDGDYTVTPSDQVQTLVTEGKMLRQSITINPIPNNYGLITWNGSTLTVS